MIPYPNPIDSTACVSFVTLQLCRERRYPYVRLDGSTTINKRQKLVNTFCDPNGGFLSYAG